MGGNDFFSRSLYSPRRRGRRDDRVYCPQGTLQPYRERFSGTQNALLSTVPRRGYNTLRTTIKDLSLALPSVIQYSMICSRLTSIQNRFTSSAAAMRKATMKRLVVLFSTPRFTIGSRAAVLIELNRTRWTTSGVPW